MPKQLAWAPRRRYRTLARAGQSKLSPDRVALRRRLAFGRWPLLPHRAALGALERATPVATSMPLSNPHRRRRAHVRHRRWTSDGSRYGAHLPPGIWPFALDEGGFRSADRDESEDAIALEDNSGGLSLLQSPGEVCEGALGSQPPEGRQPPQVTKDKGFECPSPALPRPATETRSGRRRSCRLGSARRLRTRHRTSAKRTRP